MKLLKQAIGIDVSKDSFNVKYGIVDIDFNVKFNPGKVFKNNLTGIKNSENCDQHFGAVTKIFPDFSLPDQKFFPIFFGFD